MRTAFVLALSIIVAPAAALARHPLVEALPVIARLEEPRGTVFILRGRLSKEMAAQAISLARAVQRDVARRFLGEGDKSLLPPVDLCLFATTASHRAFANAVFGDAEKHSDLGFYYPGERVVAANLGWSLGNLRHEMAHALLGDDFPEIPSWLNEGFGALYGTAAQGKDGFFFLVNYRLKDLRAARAAGTLPDLAALAASDPRDVYGDGAPAFYGLSRYLLLFLEAQGRLKDFYVQMKAEPPTRARQVKLLERFVDFPRFLAWTETLKMNTVPPAPR